MIHMAIYKAKDIPPTIDALMLPDGEYVYISSGKLVSSPKAEFEAKYEPVSPAKQG